MNAIFSKQDLNQLEPYCAFNGSWQKRGHTSLNGVVTAVHITTGKVLYAAILSKYCKCRGRFSNVHSASCEVNYSGGSCGVEVARVVQLFERSIVKHGVCDLSVRIAYLQRFTKCQVKN